MTELPEAAHLTTGKLVHIRFNQQFLPGCVVHNEVLTGKDLGQRADADFGCLQVLRRLDPMGIAVRVQLENVKRCCQVRSLSPFVLLSKK